MPVNQWCQCSYPLGGKREEEEEEEEEEEKEKE